MYYLQGGSTLLKHIGRVVPLDYCFLLKNASEHNDLE